MSDRYEVKPISHAIEHRMRPPGSKSITNRALVCAALADGTSQLSGALDSEDTQVMIAGLQKLGVTIEVEDRGQSLTIEGVGGVFPTDGGELYIANSGTTIRFLTAMLTLANGKFRLDGTERMRQRPIGDLADALNNLGAEVTCEGANACPPVAISAKGLAGGTTTIRGNISSQYLSGLMMAAPAAEKPITLKVDGELVSKPYVTMTQAVMRSFGAEVEHDADWTEIAIAPQAYRAIDYAIEPDASAASYFWGAAAITGGRVTVEGLNANALQGDVGFVDCLEKMGCKVERAEDSITMCGESKGGTPLRGVELDMNAISDTVQTLAAVALFADGPTTITGVAHNRHKETDRIGDLATELRRLGAKVDEHHDGLTITPGKLRAAEIQTYHDHRMAMSMALVGLRQEGVVILDPGCTGKTYPEFFTDLEKLSE